MDKTVWLIRHGESESNAGLPTDSTDSIPLTEKGFRQAESVAASFPVPPTLIVVSPYLRARQTAAPLIRRFASALLEEWPVEEFTYLNGARFGRSTKADRQSAADDFWDRADVSHRDGDGAESFADLIARARTTLEKLQASDHQTIAIFSHGQFLRALMWVVLTNRVNIDSDSMLEYQHFLFAVPFENAAIQKMKLIGSEIFLGAISNEHL
ncbi:MAG: phosphoglycerate mutase family protein [Acidobacteria bacterium]|nr:phosphoglycerate mutase family protein [Acidobacteriota bacterium]MBK8149099.1 phosphoglycerate mutase family protein [Acidobacteriota bacterium]